jgi:hypothetical protein
MDNLMVDKSMEDKSTMDKSTVDNSTIENLNEDYKILMRQTTYTEEECKEKLLTKTLDECIKEYLGVSKKEEKKVSTNQNIFKVIREFF